MGVWEYKNKLNSVNDYGSTTNMRETEKLRIDKYLWAIRLFKTRSLASDACEKGKVKNESGQIKPSKQVHMGDVYEVKTEAKRWRIQVTGLLDHRLAHSEAIKYYLDITPAEEVERIQFQAATFHTGKRLSKVGRPTKKQRRDLDEMGNPPANLP
jgi:ribosome-associated heat shock protein Hsp15